MSSALPTSDDGTTKVQLPVLGGPAYTCPFTATSARFPLTLGGNILHSFYATQDCFVVTGNNSVVATSVNGTFMPAGRNGNFGRRLSDTHIAVIRATVDGTLYFSEGAERA
jgi:hypothetical protein